MFAPGHGHEPRERVCGGLVLPVPVGREQRLLDGVLGRREVGSTSHEDTQNPWADLLEEAVQRAHVCLTHVVPHWDRQDGARRPMP